MASFEAILVDLKRYDLVLKSGTGYAEFGGPAGGSVHPSSALTQRSLNDLLLLRRKPPKRFKSAARHCNGRLSRKPTFID